MVLCVLIIVDLGRVEAQLRTYRALYMNKLTLL